MADKIISFLADLPVHTITCDNRKEFTDHEKFTKALGAEVYYSHPYVSWQNGANENTNDLIRQYIPKRTESKKITNEYNQFVENRLNTRSRKCLLFKPPVVFLNNHGCT